MIYMISILGGTGLRATGSFLQARVPDRIAFPCDVKHQRSRTVPTNVHQLRPGRSLKSMTLFEYTLIYGHLSV